MSISMEPFHYRNGQRYCEEIPIAEIAEKYSAPLYVYSQNAIVGTLDALKTAFAEVDPLICYAVKANSNFGILKVMAERGSGFDVVSAGELYRVLQAEGSPEKIVFAGVGKTDEEIQAGLEAGVLMFNVESEAELEAITRVAASIGKVAMILIRVNPDVDPETHRYISTGKEESKFGMDIARVERAAETATTISSIRMIGMHMHIGSQINTTEPYAGAVARGVKLIGRLRRLGHPIAWYNIGGGYGINYKGREAWAVEEFAWVIVSGIKTAKCRLAIKPGRVIAGNAGILVSRVVDTKQSGEKRFLIQDAAMNDLIRPVLDESFHRIWPVVIPAGMSSASDDAETAIMGTEPGDVVGPVCESGDVFAKDRLLPRLDRGSLLAIFCAGAYGMVMASNCNTRPRAPEILVDGSHARLIRRRETYEGLVRQEVEIA